MRGTIDTSYIDWPPNVDLTYITTMETRSGLKFSDLNRALDSALGSLNSRVDPLLANLMAPPTTKAYSRSSRNDRMQIERRSEFTIARPQFVKSRAHMLAIADYDVGIGFTEDGLEAISREDFDDQVRAMVEGWEAQLRFDVLARLFDPSEITVAQGVTSTSPGLAGSGTGDNVFSGTMPDGTVINTGTYTHYLRDTSANRAAVVKQAAAILRKWRQGPYELIGSEAFVGALIALGEAGGFYAAGSPLIRLGGNANEAQVDPDDFVGVFKTPSGDIKVRAGIIDFSSDHAVVYKSGGSFSDINPIVMRYDPLKGRDIIVRSRELYPLANAVSLASYGMNINNRVSAVAITIAASGNYVLPTFV